MILEKGGLWSGYLVISLRGSGIARLINLTVRRGIHFWDLRYRGDTVEVKIRPRDFKKLRPLLRKSGCRVEIIERKGALFLLLEGRRRKGLVLGIALSCFLLYFFSLYIWSINIEGNERIESEEILAALENLGVKQGMPRKDLDLEELERKLLLDMEELSWVGANIKGVYLHLQVEERVKEPFPEEEAVDLVASRDGLVQEVLVLLGEAAVETGDTVQEGQLLIAGRSTERQYLNDEFEETVTAVRARGMVEALVWYESYVQVPLYETHKTRTGSHSRSLGLRLGDSWYHLWGEEEAPYRNYEMEIIKRTMAWRNLRFPVEVISSSYWELELGVTPLARSEALVRARSRAMEEVSRMVPRSAEIKNRYVDDFYFEELEAVGCRVVIETLEDIAVPEITPQEGRDNSS